jgi:D-alanyl-D-alanine carboxypeptidase
VTKSLKAILTSTVLLISFISTGCSESDNDNNPNFLPNFEQRVAEAFKMSVSENGFPGGVLGIARVENNATLTIATGMSEALNTTNLDQHSWVTKTAMTTDTHSGIASISKPFTAIMILMLVDEEILTLDQTIEDFFPGLVPNSAIITIRNLLNMTSGLYDHENYLPLAEETLCGDLTIYYAPEELIAMSNALGEGSVLFEPGEYYSYSNTNFTILAMIAQEVTGKTYKELITDLIIRRLDLSGTSVPGDYETTMPSPYAHGYDIPAGKAEGICSDDTSWRDYSIQNMSWDLGAGSIASTAKDLLRFMKAIITGELISPGLKEQMLTPPQVNDLHSGRPSAYGLGIMVQQNGAFIGHSGGNFGYNTIMCCWEGYFYAILLNAGGFITNEGAVKTTQAANILMDVKEAVSQ